MTWRVAKAQVGRDGGADAPGGQVLLGFKAAPQLTGIVPGSCGQEGGVAWRQLSGLPKSRSSWTSSSPGRKPGSAFQPPQSLRQAEVLDALDEVQHVPSQATAKAVEPLGVGVHREAALRLLVEGADALADSAPSPELYTGRLHGIAQGMSRLQRWNVDCCICYDHDAPPVRGRRPRRLRRETILPGRQRIPSAATTSSIPPSARGARAAARPVPWL